MTHGKASADILASRTGPATPPGTPEAWIARMRARLDSPGRAGTGGAEAAVLAPLILREGRLRVILTLRPETLPRHAGQVCFPGGRIQDGEDGASAALRETHEEIGVAPDRIELLGRWETLATSGGMRVAPFAGLVDPRAVPQACPREVAAIFAVPLDYLLDPANRRETSLRAPDGTTRRFDAIHYHDYIIWGATAAMLGALGARLAAGGER